jgi:hypothetical protein
VEPRYDQHRKQEITEYLGILDTLIDLFVRVPGRSSSSSKLGTISLPI